MAEQQSPEKRPNSTLMHVSTKTMGKKRSSRLSNRVKKRDKANDRERSRMAGIRGGFKLLRKHIPGKFAPPFKHLPKIQILHYAMAYISELSDILQSDEVKEVDFSGKSYPLHKTSKLRVEEMAEQFGSELTPPASGDEEENITFRFDDISISQLQSPTITYQAVQDKYSGPENTDFDSVEYLLNTTGYLTRNVQSPAPGDTMRVDVQSEDIKELEESLTPTLAEDKTFQLEDYLEEEYSIAGYLTPNIQSPAPADTTQIDFEFHDELEEPLAPTPTESETFNLEDYLEDIFPSVTECEADDSYKLGLLVYPDFSDLLTPSDCSEILGQIA